jgi:DNA-directed RNA polymerase specialized sigma24 family protein
MPSANPRFELLNSLMHDPVANREAIAAILQELALVKAGNFHFVSTEDAQDAAGDAVLLALRKLHCYRPEKNAACTYFGRLMTRSILKTLQQHKSQRHQRDQPVDDADMGGSILDRGFSPWGKPLPPKVDCRLQHCDDRRRAADVIDDALRGALDERERNDADWDEKVELAIAILQMIRKRLLGRFNRMVTDQAIRGGAER